MKQKYQQIILILGNSKRAYFEKISPRRTGYEAHVASLCSLNYPTVRHKISLSYSSH